MSPGRKRKLGLRHPCGKRMRQEIEKETKQVVINARQRLYGVTEKQADDQRLSSALGRLAVSKKISDLQYDAGLRFGELYHRHHRTIGLPIPTPRSIGGRLISGCRFGGSAIEPNPGSINRLKRRFEEAASVLDQADRNRHLSPGRPPTLLIYLLVCVDDDTMLWPDEDLENLRAGLNALIQVFRLAV